MNRKDLKCLLFTEADRGNRAINTLSVLPESGFNLHISGGATSIYNILRFNVNILGRFCVQNTYLKLTVFEKS